MTAAWDSQNGGRAIAVTMASAKKVRRQKFLKIFLPECFVEPKELLYGRPCESVDCLPKCFLSR
jgi:hypothetical protein